VQPKQRECLARSNMRVKCPVLCNSAAEAAWVFGPK